MKFLIIFIKGLVVYDDVNEKEIKYSFFYYLYFFMKIYFYCCCFCLYIFLICYINFSLLFICFI